MTATATPGEPGADPRELPSAVSGVSLWWCALDRTPAEISGVAALLSPAERVRAARFGTDTLRHRWIAGRSALRIVLGRTLGIDPAAVAIVRGVRGRPELADLSAHIDFNVTHTRNVALMAIARDLSGSARIGVDIEHRDREIGVLRLARKFLAERERTTLEVLDPDGQRQRFLRYWTCKEAMSKATGDGLIAPFRRLEVDLSDRPRLCAGPPPYVPREWTLHVVDLPQEWLATLALWHAPH